MVSCRPTIISRGVGETREIQVPGSYMRAARVERRVMDVLPRALGHRLGVERDGVGRAVGGRHRRVGADHGLGGRRRAVELAAFVVGEGRLQGRHLVGCYASQALLIAADGGHLRDHRAQPSVGGAEHDRVARRHSWCPTNRSGRRRRRAGSAGRRSPGASRRSAPTGRRRCAGSRRWRRNRGGRAPARRIRRRRTRSRSDPAHAPSPRRSRAPW